MTITKTDIIDSIYLMTGLRKREATQFYETTMEIIKKPLESGESVLISGFGKFEVKDKHTRKGRNPATGNDLTLGAKRVVRFKNSGVGARLIPVACAFHSPIASGACERLRKAIFDIKLDVPYLDVYSNTTARPYPAEPKAIAEQLVRHLVSRVEFIREIEAMYEDGARIFVEVGPGRVLSGLIDRILSDRPHLTVISNQSGRSGLVQLHHCLGQLAAHCVPMKMDRLYEGRSSRQIDLKALDRGACEPALSPTTWFVNGGRSKPLKEVSTSGSDQGITPVDIVIAREEIAAPSTESEKEQAPASTPIKLRTVAQPSSFKPESNRQELKYSSAPSLSGNETAQVVITKHGKNFI